MFHRYLRRKDVEITSDTISAYNLIKIISHQFEEMRNKRTNLVKEINRNRDITKWFENSILRCKDCLPITDGLTTQIIFYFDDRKNFALCRDAHNPDEIINEFFTLGRGPSGFYYPVKTLIDPVCPVWDGFEAVIAKDNYDSIMGVMDSVDKLYSCFELNKEDSVWQQFSDDYLGLVLVYDINGISRIGFSVNEEPYMDYWRGDDFTEDKLSNRVISILKKMPIKISSLNEPCQTIVKEVLSQQMLPQYVKTKNRRWKRAR